MNLLAMLYMGGVVVAALVWIVVSLKRRVRSLSEELSHLKPIPATKLIRIMHGMRPGTGYLEDTELERDRGIYDVWKTIGGRKGLRAIDKNTQCLLRVFTAGESEYGAMFASDDLTFIRAQALQIQEELRLALAEERVSLYSPVTHLHAFRMARLYCDLIGRISAVADAANSTSLGHALNRL
jgi:hypothetical protein